MTFAEDRTEGYQAYIEAFPNGLQLHDDELPWQLDVSSSTEPFAVERCIELGEYLKKCAEDGIQADGRGYIDAVYLNDGVYSFHGIEETDFDTFVKNVEKLSYNT